MARVMSWHRPSDSTTANGNPLPSTMTCRLLVEPPRILPTRWPPFCPYKQAIQCTLFEINFSFEFKIRKEHVPYTDKSSILCPSPMSSPCRDITVVFGGRALHRHPVVRTKRMASKVCLSPAGGRPVVALPERCGRIFKHCFLFRRIWEITILQYRGFLICL